MAELTYTKNGDCLIPNLAKDGEDIAEEMPLGRYGLLCQNFLQKHHHSICIVQSILRMTDYNFHRKNGRTARAGVQSEKGGKEHPKSHDIC